MVTVTTKLDDDIVRILDEMAGQGGRSEVIRKALKKYIAEWKLEKRRSQVKEYMSQSGNAEEMSRLAELDMDQAAELLEEAEGK